MKGLIGVVHLRPLPGDPRHVQGGFQDVEQLALMDADALVSGGVHGILVENFGSAPFCRGTEGHRVPPHQVAALALIGAAIRDRFDVPVGVNCLRNDAPAAIGIAAAARLSFVRVNVHVGAYVTDQGLIEGEADRTVRYRMSLGAGTQVLIGADVLVKHARPLAPLEVEDAVSDAFERGCADAVILTGRATGAPVDRDLLVRARAAARERPLLIGSGLTPETAADLAPLVQGAIVGTWMKHRGDVRASVDEERVRQMAEAVAGRFRT